MPEIDRRIDLAAPGVLALAVVSTAFTGQAIATGFGFQCGFCSPGMSVTASTLGADDLDAHADRLIASITGAVARLQDVSDRLIQDLREGAGGAEEALRRWLCVEPGTDRVRPATA